MASVPLTDENWQPLDEGEIIVVLHGASQTQVAAPPPGTTLYDGTTSDKST